MCEQLHTVRGGLVLAHEDVTRCCGVRGGGLRCAFLHFIMFLTEIPNRFVSLQIW